MTMDPALEEELQNLGLGALVTLYDIDLTALGGPTLYYTPMTADTTSLGSIEYGGNEYIPFPIVAEGFAWKSGEAPPQPKVSVANINHALTTYVLTYNNLIGGRFVRTRTFEQFLDTGSAPDGDAHFPQDVFRFERKISHNETAIVWDMASWIDFQGVGLPKRLLIRDYCPLRYRNGSTGTFDYTGATCPYTGGTYFDDNDVEVFTIAEDICSHKLTGCVARYGEDTDLPFGGFPGIPKFRVN